MIKTNEQIKLSSGQIAKVMPTKSKYQNILIVELDGVLRVIDKESKTLAKTLGGKHIKHGYYIKKLSRF
ncbi:hypothetical protein [Lactococcus lactis]|uniref:hypothetical protein n=1 Tax=Lactococcus lactis TaxID=1358 RepID=UPI0028910AAD|nr:hypothetical protein [Lactococcus lactis]MDT2885572.1 hypothetical protein [Lactococcus lactis]MDT2904798.1 hypothetical protein [Lactococcus lactis]MDT2910573.1 hypothetical protein [Lactococcus lactis]MDT2929332.1 hypothetical protein [Lactococcus lactis]MDT2931682.1 hypothetical protein [Lactococcus lactis]